VGAYLRSAPAGAFDVVFLDPPYDASYEYETALGLLGAPSAEILAEGAIVIAEQRRKQRLEDQYAGLRRTRTLEQGDATLSFYAADG
jgi:16S rRNA G966 N2-methylase RsmD